jgi:CMP-N-acetylneuraminic acid synthetase
LKVGIVCAKGESKRFPNKNLALYYDMPLFMHSVRPLQGCDLIDEVYVATDSPKITAYCDLHNIKVIHRNANAALPEEPIFDAIKYAFKALPAACQIVVSIMANCPGHTVKDVRSAIKLLTIDGKKEVRSFDNDGHEAGLLAFRREVLIGKHEVSTYLGAIDSRAKEIHYKKDLSELKANQS